MATISATDQPKMIDGFAPLLPGFTVVEFDNLAAAEAAIDRHTAGFLVKPAARTASPMRSTSRGQPPSAVTATRPR